MNDAKTLIRPNIVPPKAFYQNFLRSRQKRLACEALLDKIWREFLKQLDRPIRNLHGGKYRIVEVLGCIRYYIHRDTGAVHSAVRHLPGYGKNCFVPLDGNFLADLPLRLNLNVVDIFLKSWDAEIFEAGPGFEPWDKFGAEDFPGAGYWEQSRFNDALQRAFLTAIRQTVYWKRLRYRVRDALKLDPVVLDIARRSVIERGREKLIDVQYNHVVEHLEDYLQINRDAPQLLWLYTLALEENFRLPKRELLKALKAKALESGWGERGWRLVANHRLRDFEPAVEVGRKKWQYLTEYVLLHVALDRSSPINKRLAHFFNEPHWKLVDDRISYRNVDLHPATLNHLIDAAAQQQDMDRFLRDEVSVVLTWLDQEKPTLDRNQLRSGWSWLYKNATTWKTMQIIKGQLQPQSWECKLRTTEIGGYHFIPLENAWQVRLEALQQRHCADGYIDSCLAGTYRIFAVADSKGKHKATAAYSFLGRWDLDQIKGFANKAVSPALKNLAESLAGGLEVLDEGSDERQRDVARVEAEEAAFCAFQGAEIESRPYQCSRSPLGRAISDILEKNSAGAGEQNDLEDEADGPLCPFCGGADGGCEHLVACFDFYSRGICGGQIYDDCSELRDSVAQIFVKSIQKGSRLTGLGDGFDDMLTEIIDSGEDPLEFADRNGYDIEKGFCELIDQQPGVVSNSWDFDSLPGQSTTYIDYWAENPKQVVRQVFGLIGPKKNL